MAPVNMKTCSPMEDEYAKDELWFIDDPRALTLRHNWRTDVLDILLERTEYCGKIIIPLILYSVFSYSHLMLLLWSLGGAS